MFVAGGALAGAAYYLVNIGLLTTVISLETRERWARTLRTRFAWLFPHYLVYGVVGAMVALAYDVAGVLALFVFALPLLLVRKAQLDYIDHTEESVRRLREAAETIERQNESLTEANVLLRDRATEAMESLAAAVDARDTYTAGHSRRVQEIAVAIGRELELDGPELESLSFAALFHDVGQARGPGRAAAQVRSARRPGVVGRAPARGGGRADHRPPGLPRRRDAGDQAPPRALRRHGVPGRPRGPGDPSRRAHPPRRRCVRLDDHDSGLPGRQVARRSTRRAPRGSGTQFCPTCVAALEALVAAGALAHVLGVDAPPAAA